MKLLEDITASSGSGELVKVLGSSRGLALLVLLSPEGTAGSVQPCYDLDLDSQDAAGTMFLFFHFIYHHSSSALQLVPLCML